MAWVFQQRTSLGSYANSTRPTLTIIWPCVKSSWREARQILVHVFSKGIYFESRCNRMAEIRTRLQRCCIRARKLLIIMSYRPHGYPWPSLATSPCHSLPQAGLQGYIPFPHRAAVCMFELVVLLLPGHMRGSIGVHHLWARPCFSSSVLCVWFV